MTTTPGAETRERILDGAERVLAHGGLANVSTRKVAEAAEVPLSQIHYHFGSKQGLLVAVLRRQDARLVARQEQMYAREEPLWRQWERACDHYDDDLESGYVALLQQMIAAGWTDEEIGADARAVLQRWIGLLVSVAERAERAFGGFGALSPSDLANLVVAAWLGAESMHLLGMAEVGVDLRGTFRRLGHAIRALEEASER